MTWWEKSLRRKGKQLKNSGLVGNIRHGQKNSDMVDKIPTWSEKFQHGRKNSDMAGKKGGEG
jgi:hypothetical protein